MILPIFIRYYDYDVYDVLRKIHMNDLFCHRTIVVDVRNNEATGLDLQITPSAILLSQPRRAWPVVAVETSIEDPMIYSI